MRAVFLHVLGDALGSVIVIVSALMIKFVKGDWKYKVDPAMRFVSALWMIRLLFSFSLLSLQHGDGFHYPVHHYPTL
jgi:zinc transporter 1